MRANECEAKSDGRWGSLGTLDLQLMSEVGAPHPWGLH